MRRIYISSMAASLLFLIFFAWWNYGVLSWSEPHRKMALRNWYWRHFGDPFDKERHNIAGFDPVDCSAPTPSGVTIGDCISAAIHQRRAFQSRANFCGIDSCGATGVIGSRGGVAYQVDFDVSSGFVSVTRRRCPLPLQIGTNDIGFGQGYTIECLPPATSEEQLEVLRDDWAENRINGRR